MHVAVMATDVGNVIGTCDLLSHQVCGCGLLCVCGKWLHPESKQVGCHLVAVCCLSQCVCVGIE